MNEKRNTFEKLRSSKERRNAYVSATVTMGLPFQIRALRRQRGWSQQQLAEKAGMRQPRISAVERPGYKGFTLDTLKRLASAFDVALQIRFTSFSDLVDASLGFSPDTFSVPTFQEDMARQLQVASPPIQLSAAQHGKLVQTKIQEISASAAAATRRDYGPSSALGSYFELSASQPIAPKASAREFAEVA